MNILLAITMIVTIILTIVPGAGLGRHDTLDTLQTLIYFFHFFYLFLDTLQTLIMIIIPYYRRKPLTVERNSLTIEEAILL